ncbi:LPS-assembly lipoprotein LptE [Noviherbaspirillum galbum]|uniref:LPS-assembly lipoprotein LptE n=1 Tax=Noviherbaspirillum galbum TaxID=2709383 RepID=A0A6B3SIS7_9BURK|nr:LPS assembly lipoprotein LptE [Noviherbaspirillum galbum]NEX60731.1 hypothetical protein [Noviherbaspirillum galbum]
MNTQRRALLAIVPALAGAAALAGCGFQLRGSDGSAAIPFKTIYLTLPDTSPLGVELRRNLRGRGVNIVADRQGAEAVIEALAETRDRVVQSLNTQGRIRELALLYRLRFRILDRTGKELLVPTDITLKRIVTYNESQAVAKEKEEELLYRDMQSDLVQQVLRRLSALNPA